MRPTRCLLRLALLLTLSLWTACDLFQDRSLSFQNIDEARRLDVPEPKTAVFRTETQWRDFWNRRVAAEDGMNPSPPAVDFDTEMVVGLFWGQRSGCSSTVDAIEKVTGETDGAVVVQVKEGYFRDTCKMST